MTEQAVVDGVDVRETPTGWLATSGQFPRIGVTAETREAALVELEAARGRWLALSTQDAP